MAAIGVAQGGFQGDGYGGGANVNNLHEGSNDVIAHRTSQACRISKAESGNDRLLA
jgi:hypothetical protein